MILKGASNIDPVDIRDKSGELMYRVRNHQGIVWQRTPDVLTGHVVYEKENAEKARANIGLFAHIYLYDKDMVELLHVTTSDSSGYYEISDRAILHETRFVRYEINHFYGGLSSGDALAVSLYVAGTPPLFWTLDYFLNYVADVNGDGDVTSAPPPDYGEGSDAYMIFQRHVGNITEFLGVDDNLRDWCFYCHDFFDGEPMRGTYYNQKSMIFPYYKQSNMDIWTRCYGDVRGTFVPSYLAEL